MNTNKAVIPLYLNNSMAKNLFTIVVKEFVEIESLIATNELAVKLHAPISEFMGQCDRYVQGNFDLELSREMVKKTINAQISKEIEVFIDLRKLLNENNLLKEIHTKEDILSINQNDFIEFETNLAPNPLFMYIEDLIKVMEFEITFAPALSIEDSEEKNIEMKQGLLSRLKKDLEEWKSSKCVKFLSDEIGNTDIRILVPLEIKYMMDNLDYMNSANVTILGKVVKTSLSNKNHQINLLSNTCFDYLKEEHFRGFNHKINMNTYRTQNFSVENLTTESPLIEIVPIAIYV